MRDETNPFTSRKLADIKHHKQHKPLTSSHLEKQRSFCLLLLNNQRTRHPVLAVLLAQEVVGLTGRKSVFWDNRNRPRVASVFQRSTDLMRF